MLIKKILLILIFFIFYSCQGKNDKSLILLGTAFETWYNQNHKLDINYTNYGYHYYNNFYDKNDLNEYIKDLLKFQLELSQINITKLHSNNFNNYLIISELISNLLIVNKHNEYLDVNIFLHDFYYSLFNIVQNPQLKMNDKVESLFENLNIMNNTITMLLNENIKVYSTNKSKYMKNAQVLNNYINYIPLEINSDSKTLDSLDNMILSFKNNFKLFNNLIYNVEYKDLYTKNKYLYNELTNNISRYFNIKSIEIDKNKDYKYSLKQLLDRCTHFYLKKNDEPVWSNLDDSLNVIKWVLENELGHISKTRNVLNDYYNKLNDIDTYLIKEDITLYNKLPSLSLKKESFHLFEKISLISYDNVIINTDSSYSFNEYIIYNDIMNNILMNYYFNQSKETKLAYKINDKYYKNGLSKYLKKILLDYHNDDMYHILYNLELLRDVVMMVCQEEYFKYNSNKNEIMFILNKYGLFNEDESLEVYNDLINLNQIYLKDYYHFIYFNDNKNDNINNFINIGYSPLSQ